MSTNVCQVFLHPAVAGNPTVIRQIYEATGLRAIVGNNPHAPTLTRKAPAKRPAASSELAASFRLFFARRAAAGNPGTSPDGGDAA